MSTDPKTAPILVTGATGRQGGSGSAVAECLRNLGLPVVGTIGVLVMRKDLGIVRLLRPLPLDLEASGLYPDGALKEEVLLRACSKQTS
jgi:predicted nucleic acid-binding protein